MILTTVISKVFNSNKNCHCSQLYHTKISEESSVQRVKLAQSCVTRNILILFAAVLRSAHRIEPPIKLPPQNTTPTDWKSRTPRSC